MRTFDKLRSYWTLTPPVYLKRQPNFDGVCITPEHQTKHVLNVTEVDEEVTVITPVHTGRITRGFGDLLAEERGC